MVAETAALDLMVLNAPVLSTKMFIILLFLNYLFICLSILPICM